jgi:hypothetical protein
VGGLGVSSEAAGSGQGRWARCLSVTIAGLVLERDRLMGIGQAIMMPLLFASNALYPDPLSRHFHVIIELLPLAPACPRVSAATIR